MDKQIPTGSISGIRTYASDLEKKKAASTSSEVPVDTKSKPTSPPEVVLMKKPEERKYQAPSWTGNKKVATPVVEEKTENLPEIPKEKDSPLKPISAPKNNNERSIIIDNEDAASAVIISDTKKDRFKLFPRIFSSISDWFKELKSKREAKKIPKYTIPEATRRKGVIQRATSKTGKLTSFDHTSIQERIRARKEKAVPKEPLTIWTAKTEPGYALLEAPESPVTNVQVIMKKSFKTINPAPEPEKIVVPEAPKVVTPIIVPPVVETPVISEVPKPVIPTPPQAQAVVVPTIIEEEPEAYYEPEPVEVVKPTDPVTKLKPNTLRDWLFLINTNVMSVGVAGIVLGLVIFGTVGYFWYNSQVSTLEIVTAPNHPAVLSAPLQLVTLSTKNKVALLNSISSNSKQSNTEVLQMIYVDTPAGNKLIPAPEIISLLSPNLNTAFTQSIANIYFGSLRKETPFIILTITDLATAKGGMLAWEQTLYTDLASLFISNENTSGLKFKDLLMEKTDLRVLQTSAGTSLLTYGTVNQNTIIITTDVSSYKELVKLIK